MNVLKKFAVSLTALTTLATLGIGSFSVSANEPANANMNLLADTATEEEAFIASYTKADEKLAANYYIENGLSLADAKNMMDVYQEGSREIAAASTKKSRAISTGTNFYNTSYLSSNQHYGVAIANNGSACTDVSLRVGYNPSWISFNSSLNQRMINDNSNFSFTLLTAYNFLSAGGIYVGDETTVTPSAVFEVPFNVVMTQGNQGSETYSEGTLYHQFTFSRISSSPIAGDSTFCYETYVNGDVNHDGRVTAADVNYLTQYNLQEITLDELAFTYTDKSENIANIVNKLAMDTDKDGDVGIADLIIIEKTIE